MKYAALFLLLFLVKPAGAQDRQLILDVLDRQTASWNQGDLEAFMQDYWKSDSLLYVGKSGPRYGWENALAGYKKGYPDKAAMGTLSFTILKVDFITRKDAFVLGRWHLKREHDEPEGYFTLIFKKFGKAWKIVSDHSS